MDAEITADILANIADAKALLADAEADGDTRTAAALRKELKVLKSELDGTFKADEGIHN